MTTRGRITSLFTTLALLEGGIFDGNRATLFDGGAIRPFDQTQTPSSVTVRASTFTDEQAMRAGGAVRGAAPFGTCTLENVRLSGNTATQTGGGTELSVKSRVGVVTLGVVVTIGALNVYQAARGVKQGPTLARGHASPSLFLWRRRRDLC